MNDELTPQEQEAFANLSRERMPAGLEERVVGAMREHGFVTPKRARVVRITNSRVAGLLAACAVLVIGAYSIGLHRGDDRALQGVTPTQFQGITRSEEADRKATRIVTRESGDAQGGLLLPKPVTVEERAKPNLKWKLETQVSDGALKKDAEREQLRAEARSDEPVASVVEESVDMVEKSAVADSDKRTARERQPATSPPSPALKSFSDAQSAMIAPQPERKFLLNGSALIVSAPDSVRIVQDAQGRVLLIYTSDGIIKIRLADTP